MNGFLSNTRLLFLAVTAIISLHTSTVLASSTQESAIQNSDISIDIPKSSLDGAFVVKVSAVKNAVAGDTHVELWRSFNGGQYQLVSSQPQFHAVSQMLHREGTYTYQARIVSALNTVQSASPTSIIDVSVRFPQLAN